jgi:alpha-galactosidase
MGWNRWDCYGPTVTEAETKANAEYMAKYLKASGWEYVVVDIRWYVGNDTAHGYNEINPDWNIDSHGRFMPAPNRFPSAAGGGFRPLADYMHARGLKFGIHLMRGVPMIAVPRKLPIKCTELTAADIYSPEG